MLCRQSTFPCCTLSAGYNFFFTSLLLLSTEIAFLDVTSVALPMPGNYITLQMRCDENVPLISYSHSTVAQAPLPLS